MKQEWIDAYAKCPVLWTGDGSFMTNDELDELAGVINTDRVSFDVYNTFNAFDWRNTDQGYDYWEAVNNAIHGGYSLRIRRNDHIPQVAMACGGGGGTLVAGGGGGGSSNTSIGNTGAAHSISPDPCTKQAGPKAVVGELELMGDDPVKQPDPSPSIMDITRGMFK